MIVEEGKKCRTITMGTMSGPARTTPPGTFLDRSEKEISGKVYMWGMRTGMTPKMVFGVDAWAIIS